MALRRALLVVGTRPEAIKVAPVALALRVAAVLEPLLLTTGQHADLVTPMLDLFGLQADVAIQINRTSSSLDEVVSATMTGLAGAIRDLEPDLLLVQGDTTSVFAAALGGFYADIPVVHLEAGLRTDDRRQPFPEEANRRMVSQLASLHCAPTTTACDNLLRDGVDRRDVVITGNTIIDALQHVLALDRPFEHPSLRGLEPERRLVLVTVHRRESWGTPMEAIGAALAELADRHPDVRFVVPLHPNPTVRAAVEPQVAGQPNVTVLEPVGYSDLVGLLRRSVLVLTDSGGIQEEAPSLGVPVLVLRERTERPEGVTAGTAAVVGTTTAAIVERADALLADERARLVMARAVNPYGDGHAAGRVAAAMAHLLGLGPPAEELGTVG